MSSTYSKNRKELAGLQLMNFEDVTVKNKTGKPRLRRDLDIVGKIDRTIPNFILSPNELPRKTHFVDDTAALPKETKKKVVNHFMNERTKTGRKRQVVYLVRTDKQSKTKKK